MIGIIDEIRAAGCTISKFCEACPIAYHTLKRIHAGHPVRADLIAKAMRKLRECQDEFRRGSARAV